MRKQYNNSSTIQVPKYLTIRPKVVQQYYVQRQIGNFKIISIFGGRHYYLKMFITINMVEKRMKMYKLFCFTCKTIRISNYRIFIRHGSTVDVVGYQNNTTNQLIGITRLLCRIWRHRYTSTQFI